MSVKKVFVDSEDTILAVHDEAQEIADGAYDAIGVGETRVIYLNEADIPQQEVVNGAPAPWKMPAGWWDNMNDVVPAVITSTQGKITLHAMGKLADVEAAIAGLPTDIAVPAQIKFNAQNWYRADPMFDQIGGVVGMTPEQIDAAFIAARDAA